jgi:type VI secretion system protein ImpC
VDFGWCAQICGPETGGNVEDLPIHNFDMGKGTRMKIPTEIAIPQMREFDLADQGFIPFCGVPDLGCGFFSSANSVHRPDEFVNPTISANERVNTQLPSIFLTARLAHYLKVLQRENIGATKSASLLEQELNNWIKTLVTEMKNPGPELAATHPLSYGNVVVAENPDDPGFFRVTLSVVPHFQIEGTDIYLTLVSRMPQGN